MGRNIWKTKELCWGGENGSNPPLQFKLAISRRPKEAISASRSLSGSWGEFNKEIKSCLNISDKI